MVKPISLKSLFLIATLSIATSTTLLSQQRADASDAPVIVIDPGHSGLDKKEVDPQTKLVDHDYPNHPEMEECFRVSQLIKTKLEKDGYKVILTKKTENDTVSLRERATIAKSNHAALAVSIHNDHGRTFHKFAEVYFQGLGQWRGGAEAAPKAKFDNEAIAATSKRYAQIFATERTKTEHHKVSITVNSFNNRPGIEPGNIPQVMLFAGFEPDAVPWIYNEVGGQGLTKKNEAEYAAGVANAIEKCVVNKSDKKQPVDRRTVQ